MRYFVVDAFADGLFAGNPAGVCLLEGPVPDARMQAIAAENNLPETAFLLREGDGYRLRWFTPGFEINLCGHATLASAHVVFTHLEPAAREVAFHTLSGRLTARREGEGVIRLFFPSLPPHPVETTAELVAMLGQEPLEFHGERDLYALLASPAAVAAFRPDYERLADLPWLNLVVTAKGEDGVDFVSRVFCPELRAEDPVTGSVHSSLIPFWSARLGKTELLARQLSARGGTLHCRLTERGVEIGGRAVEYLRGELLV